MEAVNAQSLLSTFTVVCILPNNMHAHGLHPSILLVTRLCGALAELEAISKTLTIASTSPHLITDVFG